jgi:predicted AlkP superfamily pyrophosphatase or phosphodiesterase
MRRRLLPLALAGLFGSLLVAQQPNNPFEPPHPKGQPKKPPPNVAQKPPNGPPAPKLPPQVLVVSLDGAGVDELRHLYEDGVLTEDGFSRFFQEGEVAEALIPVNPTLTAPNHASLATGLLPERTGLVSNHFHPAGSPPLTVASGFATPFSGEAIWETVRRLKKRAALIGWPDSSRQDPHRRGDWGLDYSPTDDAPPFVVSLQHSDWQPLQLPVGSVRPPSFSPPLVARLTMPGAQGEGHEIEIVAVDTTDNATVDYDAIAIVPSLHAGAHVTPTLAQGEWMSFNYSGGAGQETCWAKLLAIDGSLESTKVYIGGSNRTLAYPAPFAAQLAAEEVAWPGPPDDLLLSDNARLPTADLDTWGEQAARFASFFGDTLRLAVGHRDWDLIMGYIPSLDQAGHALTLTDALQEGYTEERRDAFTAAREGVWKAVDGEVRRLVASVDLSRTTVVLVSDHGMLPVHTTLDLNARLRDQGLLKVGAGGEIVAEGTVAYAVGDGGVAHVYLSEPTAKGGAGNASATAAANEATLASLQQVLGDWKVEGDTPFEKIVTRHEAAELGLDSPASGDLIVFAKEGFAFSGDSAPHATDTYPAHPYGSHGYLNTHPAMRAIYLALGANVKAGSTGAVKATELAARVTDWLGLAKKKPGKAAH